MKKLMFTLAILPSLLGAAAQQLTVGQVSNQLNNFITDTGNTQDLEALEGIQGQLNTYLDNNDVRNLINQHAPLFRHETRARTVVQRRLQQLNNIADVPMRQPVARALFQSSSDDDDAMADDPEDAMDLDD